MKNKIKNALLSVYNKEGILEFASSLCDFSIKIVATSGTAKILLENDIKVDKVEDVYNISELLDGRVKTLHPNIFASILADRSKETHISQLKELGLEPIDLVVVNLYPFANGLEKRRKENDLIELIDIGGVSLLRAAAKNYKYCIPIFSPSQYNEFIDTIKRNKGEVTIEYRKKQAMETFKNTFGYDRIISKYFREGLKEEEFPEIFTYELNKVMDLRYGENPHQKSAMYSESTTKKSFINSKVLSGKPMSYNNWMDADTAISVVSEFEKPSVSIIKHAAPCGVGVGENIYDAFNRAYITDPVSSFGGIVAANREIDLASAKDITSSYFEVVIAPSFVDDALKTLKTKKNMRVIKLDPEVLSVSKSIRVYSIKGGLLVQESDSIIDSVDEWELVSDTKPTEKELKALDFAWKVVKWVKSNGIVIAIENRTIGIGTGQPSRVDSVELAVKKAGAQGHHTAGTALASDGFFPFRDSIDEAAKAGITAIVEPGGSIRDQEVIDAANEHEIALLFTRKRHFRH
jgi:phosphoribosylaminoimidazolecarboxamide formyltransferase/IMP cyclohydrolase